MYITTTEVKIPLSNLIGTEYNSVTVFRKLAEKVSSSFEMLKNNTLK